MRDDLGCQFGPELIFGQPVRQSLTDYFPSPTGSCCTIPYSNGGGLEEDTTLFGRLLLRNPCVTLLEGLSVAMAAFVRWCLRQLQHATARSLQPTCFRAHARHFKSQCTRFCPCLRCLSPLADWRNGQRAILRPSSVMFSKQRHSIHACEVFPCRLAQI